MICLSPSLNCCVVVVWFTDFMNCDTDFLENKLATSLQACTPSTHVYSVLELRLVPHFLNQAPPGAQQLSLPDFLMAAHLAHTGAILVAVTLQACKPSNHVCSTSPLLPQFFNQSPPGAQQLSLPDF